MSEFDSPGLYECSLCGPHFFFVWHGQFVAEPRIAHAIRLFASDPRSLALQLPGTVNLWIISTWLPLWLEEATTGIVTACIVRHLVRLRSIGLGRLSKTSIRVVRSMVMQYLSSLLLAAICVDSHNSATSLKLTLIVKCFLFRNTHAHESADDTTSRGSDCSTTQDCHQDTSCYCRAESRD